jgi:molecular chaperone GrpE
MTRHPKDDTLEDDPQTKTDAAATPKDEETGVELAPPTLSEVEDQRREIADLKDQLLRRRADFENYRKRVERDREQAAQDARAQVLAGLLPTLDNLDKALSTSADEGTLRAGVQLTHRNFLSFLEAQGVVAKDPTGEPFDPLQHQALLYEPVPGFPDNTVVETFRKAYFFKDRLLRPALVKVAKGADAE